MWLVEGLGVNAFKSRWKVLALRGRHENMRGLDTRGDDMRTEDIRSDDIRSEDTRGLNIRADGCNSCCEIIIGGMFQRGTSNTGALSTRTPYLAFSSFCAITYCKFEHTHIIRHHTTFANTINWVLL